MDLLGRHEEASSKMRGFPARRTFFPRFSLPVVSSEYGFLVRWVIKLSWGTIKDERQATLVLISIALVAGVIAAINFFIGFTVDVYDYLPPKR